MSTMLARIRQWGRFLKKNKQMKILSVCFLLFIIVVGVFFVPHFAHAQEGTIDQGMKTLLVAASMLFMSIAQLFIKFSIFLLRFFILLAGYNGFIEANVVKFGWNIVRDIANMFFIIILLVIAFGTILGLEQYEWKKSLPKLIFAAIFVNFSNVICQLIIDVSQVFTITFLNAVAGIASGNFIQMMNFADIVTFQKMSTDEASGMVYDLVGSSFFAVFFTGMAMATIGSYVIVMLYRIVVLWTLMIMSPLAFVFSILPSTKGYATDFWKEFINHVISAPVMVFFLWLAFATFGNGQIVDDIEANNALAGGGLDKEAMAVGSPTSVGISKASSYNNMANVLVAIAFLMVGVERVQKLGVKGGDYIQKGMDFGKNVATIATGVKAAQWGAGKAWGGAKTGAKAGALFALNKTPIISAVGPDAWKRRGVAIAGRASNIGNKANIWRDKKAAEWENTKKDADGNKRGIVGKVISGTVGKMASSFLESGARKDKLAKNWKDAAEDSKKRWELKVSTSDSGGGREKLRQNRFKDQAERMDALKREKKFAEADQEYKFNDEEFRKGEDDIQDMTVAVAAIRQAKSIIENSAKELNHAEIVAASRTNAEEMVKLNGKRQNDGSFANKVDEFAFKKAAEKMATLLTIAGNKGAEVLQEVQGVALEKVGFKESIDVSSKDQAQRAFLSLQLGRYVTASVDNKNKQEAFDQLKALHGNSAGNNIIRNFDPAAKHSAQEGHGQFVGLFDDKEVDKYGRVDYKLRGDTPEDLKKFAGARKYFVQDVSPAKLTSVSGLVNSTSTGKDGAQEMSIGTGVAGDQAMENLTAALGSMTYTTRISDRLLDSIKELQRTDSAGFNRWMEKFAKDRPQAEDALAIKLGLREDTRSSHTKKTTEESSSDSRGKMAGTATADVGTPPPPTIINNVSPPQPTGAAVVRLDQNTIIGIKNEFQLLLGQLRKMSDKSSDNPAAKKLNERLDALRKTLEDNGENT